MKPAQPRQCGSIAKPPRRLSEATADVSSRQWVTASSYFYGRGASGHNLQGNIMKEVAGKTAFVTGAASGIGLGIATALAQAGAKVMLCDIEEAALAEAVEGLKETKA